jgi:hypothetical protein
MLLAQVLPIVAVVVLAPAMLLLMVAGERTAHRYREVPAGPVEAAVLALLGLLLGFQFAGASNRLDARRQIIVREANTIGTAYLRVDLLPPDDQPALRSLFREYTTLRLKLIESRTTEEVLSRDAASRAIQGEIWSRSVAACQKTPSPATQTLVVSALNDMIDVTTERSVAAHTHTPVVVTALLLSVSLLSAFLVGYSTHGPSRPWLVRVLFTAVVAGTLYVTFDMEFPRSGLIQVGAADDAMTATLAGMK